MEWSEVPRGNGVSNVARRNGRGGIICDECVCGATLTWSLELTKGVRGTAPLSSRPTEMKWPYILLDKLI